MSKQPFFKELIEVKWSDFLVMEKDPLLTSSQRTFIGLVRACANMRLPAIKEAMNRIDGKLAAEIEVVYPKFYITFPNAKDLALPDSDTVTSSVSISQPEEEQKKPEEVPTLSNSLRGTLKILSDAPTATVDKILELTDHVELAFRSGNIDKLPPRSDPYVKSVMMASLMKLSHGGHMGAMFEVLDNIDGVVAEAIHVMGSDVSIPNYLVTEAPYGSVKNEDGVWQLEMPQVTNKWVESLDRIRGGNNDRFKR